jgi:hypothetical protein
MKTKKANEYENPVLEQQMNVDVSSELKGLIIEYTGNKLIPEDNQVTAEMVIHVLADEFPEIVLAIAEENFFRGYEQALTDMQQTQNLEQEENE